MPTIHAEGRHYELKTTLHRELFALFDVTVTGDQVSACVKHSGRALRYLATVPSHVLRRC